MPISQVSNNSRAAKRDDGLTGFSLCMAVNRLGNTDHIDYEGNVYEEGY